MQTDEIPLHLKRIINVKIVPQEIDLSPKSLDCVILNIKQFAYCFIFIVASYESRPSIV